jgi:glycosyltransferase involved in cell wall biosynthesis
VEVVVVADGEEVERQVAQECKYVKLLQTGPSAIGHPQRMLGMQQARGEWLAFMDDDDVYTPEAFDAFKQHQNSLLPVLFRMRFEDGVELWKTEDVSEGNVGTPMILCRNIPEKLGVWQPKRCGDYDFIHETVVLNGGVVWDETVVADIRRG